jgi:hypothetical protein
MKEKTKARLKIFALNQLLEPLTEKYSLPNMRTIFFILMFISALIRNWTFLLISTIGELIFYEINLYKSGEYIHWYREWQKKINKKRKEKEGERCIYYKEGKCNSDYSKNVECDGINISDDCPYPKLIKE